MPRNPAVGMQQSLDDEQHVAAKDGLLASSVPVSSRPASEAKSSAGRPYKIQDRGSRKGHFHGQHWRPYADSYQGCHLNPTYHDSSSSCGDTTKFQVCCNRKSCWSSRPVFEFDSFRSCVDSVPLHPIASVKRLSVYGKRMHARRRHFREPVVIRNWSVCNDP
ncbi:uncharacterized protein BP01DRAFT_41143 [Aspergillus saccharolyticus JOP 1030-1]|uniref:Uncharacterized protein n=1 Tax=Aspergillus saccharolyticus JOP 1030-1 TaxID=1450539 RepID=A0A318ZDM0_9EURO|nr:hypothetical protein BP01DRAFT_41143 [Aspergillus saccharolyticus JOP 1030-1]PYH45449.1 hypothetical protein BP01DRAFT_41143 [Aspergillus saccharolyticus JOP 1030-1]